jgi:hypothetical protein
MTDSLTPLDDPTRATRVSQVNTPRAHAHASDLSAVCPDCGWPYDSTAHTNTCD